MKRVIIRAYGLPADKAVKIVAMVGVDNMLKNQIDGDDAIVGFEDCMVYLTTKNRKSIGIDVYKPKVDHNNERANCHTIG